MLRLYRSPRSSLEVRRDLTATVKILTEARNFPPTEKEMSKKVCYFFPPPFLLATKLSSPPSLPLPPWLKPSWRRALLSVFRLATPTRGKPQRMMCPTMTMTRRALTT